MSDLALLVPLAHHPGAALEALPFFGPVLLIVVPVAFLMIRDRRRSRAPK